MMDTVTPGETAANSASDGMAPLERIIHLHIPKTAGTSLKAAMGKCRNRKVRVFQPWQEEEFHSFNPNDFDFYSGHIGYVTAARIGGHIISIFRNPVDRFVSVYYFWRQIHDSGREVREATQIASKYSLDEFARIKDVFALTEELCNRMTMQTAFGYRPMHRQKLRVDGKSDEDLYSMAISNIATFSVIGLQENVPEFEANLRKKFNLDISIGRVNSNAKRLPTDEISFGTKSKILEWVYMDMDLYDHVLRVCRERADAERVEAGRA